MVNMEWIICQKKERERERENFILCSRIWTKNGNDTPISRYIEAAKQNKNKRIFIFIGLVQKCLTHFSPPHDFSFKNKMFHWNSVPNRAADVKDAYSPNVWILFKGHTNITSSSTSQHQHQKNLLDNSQCVPFFLDFNLKQHFFFLFLIIFGKETVKKN